MEKEEDAITKVEMIVVDKVKDDLQNTDGVNMAGLKRVNEFWDQHPIHVVFLHKIAGLQYIPYLAFSAGYYYFKQNRH